jgi:hypothetical protein
MAGVWAVIDDADRQRWSFEPYSAVGPIRFGMSPEEVKESLGGAFCVRLTRGLEDGGTVSVFALSAKPFDGSAVTAYFDTSDHVFCVAIDALRGPQVVLGDTIGLVGRTPSLLDDEVGRYATDNGLMLQVSLSANLAVEGLGVLLLAQHAGDLNLSRPVFVDRSSAERFWDSTQSTIPRFEWPRTY